MDQSARDQMVASIISNLNLGGSSAEENIARLRSMSDMEKQAAVGNALKKSTVSMFAHVKKTVKSKPADLPLARIRDDHDGKDPFTNYLCMGCAKKSDKTSAFLQCSRCKAVKYCNRECQKRDWIGEGDGPTKPRKHKDLCHEFQKAIKEWQSHPTAGVILRTTLFSSWADQHHENGSFFRHEFLARLNLLGGSEMGFWGVKDSFSPYQTPEPDMHGYQNGQMLLGNSFPTMSQGWTKSLSLNEYPPAGPPSAPPPKEGLKCWEDYLQFRNLSPTSIAPLLLTNVLTVYQMIFRDLKLQHRNTHLSVYLLGVEVELNQIPLFGELAYLLTGINLELIMQSSAAKAICKKAKSVAAGKMKTPLLRANEHVLNVIDPVGKGRVRIKVDSEHEFFHDMSNSIIPDAVLGLNAGLASYPETWPYTMHKLIRFKIPFSFSDQTVVSQRFAEVVWMPDVVAKINMEYPWYPPISAPPLQMKLNPFHGIVGRDIAAVLVPNLDNGYLLTSCWRK